MTSAPDAGDPRARATVEIMSEVMAAAGPEDGVRRKRRGSTKNPSEQRRSVAVFVSRIMSIGATLAILHWVFRGTRWVWFLAQLFSALIFPIMTASVSLGVLLFILAAALRHRKRAAWVMTVGLFGLLGLIVLGLGTLTVLEGPDRIATPDFWVDLIPYLFNLASLTILLILLIGHRGDFTGRMPKSNVTRSIGVLVGGLVISLLVGFGLTLIRGGRHEARARFAILLRHELLGRPVPQGMPQPPARIEALVGFLVLLSLFAALVTLLRSRPSQAFMPLADELTVRDLLAASEPDSLSYFATRRDKSAVFAPGRRAAVAYRSQLSVCLASGDPIGPRDHWPAAIEAYLALAREQGLTIGVVGTTEAGATAYTRAGLRALRVGDEAVLRPAQFDLDSRNLRSVKATVRRLERLGYRVRLRRHRDIPPEELRDLIALADAWRSTETERGFSMALGRLGDPLDGDCLMVEAVFPPGHPGPDTAGILSFVPWGRRGYSLDVMRRNPDADNGVTELMVVGLMQQGREYGVEKVSLNFAVFRAALEEGSQVGATPVQRLQRRALLVASRWVQIEQLYRSNSKYDPDWQPRFLCFEDGGDIATVGLALGVAEGFIELPRRFMPPEHQPSVNLDTQPEAAAWLARQAAPVRVARRVPEQMRLRMATRQRLLDAGEQPYPVGHAPDLACADVAGSAPGRTGVLAGRVVGMRDHGGVVFLTVQDWGGTTQVVAERDAMGSDRLRTLVSTVSLGDLCCFPGTTGSSRTGTASLLATDWALTAKALRPLPDKHRGFSDPEARVRQRYLDLIVNPASRQRLASRSRAIGAVRSSLLDRGFVEVETPILQTVHGGANARPFRTHINAYDLDLYLRIAPELFLKRLVVGGVDRVFEIGRNFRNEGADATHNPEFTVVEAYQAYGDYTTMRELTRDMVVRAAQEALGRTTVRGRDAEGNTYETDLAEPWRVITVNDALSEALGEPVDADTPRERLVAVAASLGIAIDSRWSRGNVLMELYEHLVEKRTVAPTFYCDFPTEVSPLTRQHRSDPRLAERWDLVVFGAELGTAYSELADPVIQRERLTAQSLQAAGGDPEAMELDEDFLTALEHGMPPTGGMGMGLDRLVMMLTESPIREVISFPLVRPRS